MKIEDVKVIFGNDSYDFFCERLRGEPKDFKNLVI